jgi:hypothetical protein
MVPAASERLTEDGTRMDYDADELERIRAFVLESVEFRFGDVLDDSQIRGYYARLRKRLAGMRSAKEAHEIAREIVRSCRWLSREHVEELDRRLARKGLPTHASLRSIGYKSLARALARRSIRSKREYLIIRRHLSETDEPGLVPSDRSRAEMLLRKYEQPHG